MKFYLFLMLFRLDSAAPVFVESFSYADAYDSVADCMAAGEQKAIGLVFAGAKDAVVERSETVPGLYMIPAGSNQRWQVVCVE